MLGQGRRGVALRVGEPLKQRQRAPDLVLGPVSLQAAEVRQGQGQV